ncbi:MAG: hypothetical protein JO165_00845 [Candidatus Eremiobacteraeota bacterium]|nr:hypothetical protein [Candidatus Eremiobacteraeota bacterium]
MIRAYPLAATVRSGEFLTLCVSGSVTSFTTSFMRCGSRCERAVLHDAEKFRLFNAACGASDTPWHWPAYPFEVPPDWRPGAYAVALFESASHAWLPDARSHRALFVLRPSKPRAALLIVLPLFTYHAYNVAHVDGTQRKDEGDCLYSGAQWVTLQRPGGGTGGHPWDEVNVDSYDRATPRQTFAHWDLKALAWLEEHGYDYDLCTDLELHDGSIPLEAYRMVASFGHHEYWTPQMRERIERYISGGGNVAFFGGNTMWFRAEFDVTRAAVRRDGKWNDEWKTTGVTYACGGGRWIGERPRCAFRVTDASHQFLQGLALRNGDSFGENVGLIGYECDGAPDSSDLTVLAEASLESWPLLDERGERAPHGHATLGVRHHGRGAVFTASTVDWARAMQSDAIVSGITRNVLHAFGAD